MVTYVLRVTLVAVKFGWFAWLGVMCLGGLCGYRVVWIVLVVAFWCAARLLLICSLFAAITLAVVWLCGLVVVFFALWRELRDVLYCIEWFTLRLIVLNNYCFVFICDFTCVMCCCLMVGLCLFGVVEFC